MESELSLHPLYRQIKWRFPKAIEKEKSSITLSYFEEKWNNITPRIFLDTCFVACWNLKQTKAIMIFKNSMQLQVGEKKSVSWKNDYISVIYEVYLDVW